MHGGVVVKQGQEHDDAFDDGRAEPGIELAPAVRVPPINRLQLLPARGPRTALRRLHDVRHAPGVEVRFEFRLVRMRDVSVVLAVPVLPRAERRMCRVVRCTDPNHSRRVGEHRLEPTDVLVNEAVLEDEAIHIGERPPGNRA